MTKITALEFAALISKMPAKDQDFANSLLSSWNGRGLSPKQAAWVDKLAERAATGEPERKTTDLGGFEGIKALFTKANEKLKYPAMVVAYRTPENWTREVELKLAGGKSRFPGTINVVAEGTWYGRILANGAFEQSPRDEAPAEMIDLLKQFAARPAEMALAHGRLTGKCCFCNTGLSDPVSTALGYGPTCAKNWGLPHGKKAVAALGSKQPELEVAA